MSAPWSWLYKCAFTMGAALFAFACGGGVVYEVAAEHRLPPPTVDHFSKAQELLASGAYEEAKAQFRIATAIRKDMPEGFLGLADVFSQLGNLTGQEQAYRDLLSVRPHHLTARATLAGLLKDQGRLEEAIEHYAILASEAPDDGEVQLRLGALLLPAGRPAEAEAQLEKALRLLPEDPRVHNNIGVAQIQQGKRDPAILQFEAAVRLDPSHVRYRANLDAARTSRAAQEEGMQ